MIVIIIIIVIIHVKDFHHQRIDSDIKQYEEVTKLTIGQGEYCTTGCLLDYDYIKIHCRLIAVNLSKQKELDNDPKATKEREFVWQVEFVMLQMLIEHSVCLF